MDFPKKRKQEPFRLTPDYFRSDYKPTQAGNTNYEPLTGPRLERLQEPGRKRPIYGSHQAMYIGALFLGLRLTAGWTPHEACQTLGIHSYPSLNGQHLLSPASMKKRKWLEVMEKASPTFFHRRGVGDVLRAYINNQELSALYDPEIFTINAVEESVDKRKNKLLKYFGLKEIKAKHTRPLWQKPITQEDEESPNPIEPQNRLQAVAQELLFHKQDVRKKWGELSYARREALIKNEEKLIQDDIDHGTTLEVIWIKCAQALLKEATQTPDVKNAGLPQILFLNDIKKQIKDQTEAMATTAQTEPLYRRFKHLTKWMPHA